MNTRGSAHWAALCICAALLPGAQAWADGILRPPRDYKGSLEEKAQEAIIIFQSAEQKGEAVEDIILKIHVANHPEKFAWVVPFPTEPTIAKEDPKLFGELFAYVDARKRSMHRKPKSSLFEGADGAKKAAPRAAVDVLSRKVVGSFDTAVVRENVAGALNKWLEAEGFQPLPDADDVLGFYRKKGYVFACIKVSTATLDRDLPVESHPLRFRFKTGGRDGIYYPMKMTGLQTAPFDVTLYIFYAAWINDKINQYGYIHRGFTLNYRDWDTRECESNAGKTWSSPEHDPFLRGLARRLPEVKALFQKLRPGERYYLTNIHARGLKPADVRQWADDLWVFPYYTNRRFVPYDARPSGPAAAAWPLGADAGHPSEATAQAATPRETRSWTVVGLGLAAVVASAIGLSLVFTRRRERQG